MPPAAATPDSRQDTAQVRDLSGEWVIARIDGQPLAQPIALTGRRDSLVWEPECADQTISYRSSGTGIEFYRPEPEGEGERVVCEIGYPQDLPRVLDALEGRWSVSQAADGGVVLSPVRPPRLQASGALPGSTARISTNPTASR